MPRIPTLVPSGYGDVCEKTSKSLVFSSICTIFASEYNTRIACKDQNNEIYTLLYMPLIDDV